jgi:hypothetical protein
MVTQEQHDAETQEAIAVWDHKGWPCTVFSLAQLLKQDGIRNFVWPYEGQFVKGKWRFHNGTVMDGTTEVKAPTSPLLVDALSAQAFRKVYAAVNDQNKAKLAEYAQSRGLFCWSMEKLIWPNMGFRK